MADLLSIGASGVKAYQTALSVTGDNIANVGTANHARRSVRLTEVSAGVGNVELNTAGNGVLMSGIDRATNSYAAAAVRTASTDLSRTTGSIQWMDRIEGALTGNNLGARLTGFFGSATALAAEPDSTALRQGVLSAAESAAIAFTATGRAIDQVAGDIDGAGAQAASQLTALGRSLQQVNDGLGRTSAGSTAAAQLADQRDAILDSMSELVDIGVTTDQLGRATVMLGGSGGVAFVARGESLTVAYERDGGEVGFSVVGDGDTRAVTATGGTLAGIAEGAQRVKAARDNVDDIAREFAKAINDQQALGDDRTGTAGIALFDTGATATDLTINKAMTGDRIAAATRGGGVRDATNLSAIAKLRIDRGWEASLTGVTTANANALDQKKTIAEAQTAIRDGAATQLGSSTGINLDSEAVELMRYQQAYSACSRVIQVARDTFQSILDIR